MTFLFPFPSHSHLIIPILIPIPTHSRSHFRQRLYIDYLKAEKYVYCVVNSEQTRMWANAQPDGRPVEHRWRPLFNAAKFG